MSQEAFHKYVKQKDGDVICEWCGVPAKANLRGCTVPEGCKDQIETKLKSLLTMFRSHKKAE